MSSAYCIIEKSSPTLSIVNLIRFKSESQSSLDDEVEEWSYLHDGVENDTAYMGGGR